MTITITKDGERATFLDLAQWALYQVRSGTTGIFLLLLLMKLAFPSHFLATSWGFVFTWLAVCLSAASVEIFFFLCLPIED